MELIDKKLDELIEILNQDSRIVEVQNYKQKLLEKQDLLKMIEKLQQLDIYSTEYKELKIELFQDSDFVAFKHYENEINLLIMQINHKLGLLVDERGCNHENN